MDRASVLVAAGILGSRIAGFIRQRVFAHYFGLQSDAADAFTAAFRIPNFLQNLFGEGALSASFIPVYAALIARGDRKGATELAGAVASLLALVTATLVLAGVLLAPALVIVIAPGFDGAKRDLTITLVRVLFPGAGLLVLSAWCLGVLNSHRRFLLSYLAPVIWNLAMILALVFWGPGAALPRLALLLAWGAVIGSALQLMVQLPAVAPLVPGLRPRLEWSAPVQTAVRNFGPNFVSRGVVQISAYVDALLASLLPTGAVTGLANAQLLYTLPVSLFGMSVSAAALPEMAGAVGLDARHLLRDRLNSGLRQIAFFVVPSAVAFLALGDVIAAALFQTGRFSSDDARYVWAILAGSAIGLVAATLGRLYSSAYYALHDTRTPLRYALVHVGVATALGYFGSSYIPDAIGVSRLWGAAALTVAASIGAWIEFWLLRSTLNPLIGETGLPLATSSRLVGAAILAAIAGWTIRLSLPTAHPILAASVILAPFTVVYLGVTYALGLPETKKIIARLSRLEIGQ